MLYCLVKKKQAQAYLDSSKCTVCTCIQYIQVFINIVSKKLIFKKLKYPRHSLTKKVLKIAVVKIEAIAKMLSPSNKSF